MVVKSTSKRAGKSPVDRSKAVKTTHLSQLLQFDHNLLALVAGLPAPCNLKWPLKNKAIIPGFESPNKPPQSDSQIIGIDEVGRGSLAGPVVAAAVVLPEIKPGSQLAKSLALLNDSKLLKAEMREELAAIICNTAQYAICQSSVEEIDEINILQASLLAMKRARLELTLQTPQVVFVDGNKHISGLKDRQITVVKGDLKSASIAAASIIAKVYRDKLMAKLGLEFPQYHWHQNKGYLAPSHIKAIREHGLTDWHRKSFSCKSIETDSEDSV
jgi:ribonuclease HII